MTLPKSLRPRRRYVFFRVETLPDASVREDDLRRSIWFEAQNLYGDITSAETDANVVEYRDGKRGVGVVRCLHDSVKQVRASLACVHEVDGYSVGVHVLGVSGTLRSGREKYFDEATETEQVRVDGRVGWYIDRTLDVETEECDDDGFICATPNDFGKE